MSDHRRYSGGGLPDNAHPRILIDSRQKGDMRRMLELDQDIRRLEGIRKAGRCPLNAGLDIEHCDSCERGEQGHGKDVVKQQLARAQAEMAILRSEA